MVHTTLTVPDISCEHCERTITQALTPIDGVERVTVDIPQKQVSVDYDQGKVDVDRLKQILQDEDYPVASTTQS